jgi:ubiquinone/menaquinone biosynthesis C-methylase UbiE
MDTNMNSTDQNIRKVVSYYNEFDEQARLSSPWGQIEFLRTQELVRRYLKNPPAVVLDVGGATGRYACWLAQNGHQVHLIDPVPRHVRQAQEASTAQPETPIASCSLGDARYLGFEDGAADGVLLFGPLYHLIRSEDRYQSLKEAHRVLKPGGHVFAVGISRFASTIDGLATGSFLDPEFQEIMRGDLENGQHRNPTDNLAYFMDTFLHHPDELKAEVTAAGFEALALLAVEGISYMVANFDKNWEIEDRRSFLLEIIAATEQEPSLIGASPHILCVGRKG